MGSFTNEQHYPRSVSVDHSPFESATVEFPPGTSVVVHFGGTWPQDGPSELNGVGPFGTASFTPDGRVDDAASIGTVRARSWASATPRLLPAPLPGRGSTSPARPNLRLMGLVIRK